MKTTRLIALFAAAGLVFAACEKPETEDQTVAVESITLDDSIKDGATLEAGETLSIAELVTVLPDNATDKTVTYSSSRTDIATVSEEGVITAVAEGETEITVKAGDKTATFTLTVTAKPAGTVSVESITLDDEIAEGKSIEEGQTLDISGMFDVLPDNATDKTVSYSSSDEKAATITDAGVITAVAAGESTITITSNSDAAVKAVFTLTVTAKAPVNITEIKVSENTQTYTSEDRNTYDLSEYFTVKPAENTDAVTFTSSDEDVAKIENGKMSIGVAGEATITIAAQSNPDIKATITVTVNQYVGDYPRFEGDENDEKAAIEGENWYWTMTCSIDPLKSYDGRNNSLTAMLDGRSIVTRAGDTNKDDAALTNGTAFCFAQMKSVWDESDATTFTIDMGKTQAVNYFRIQNISKDRDDVQVRFCKFNKIEGSNDGTQFETIATDLEWENAIALGTTNDQGRPEYNFETENIKFGKTVNFRYLRFSCWDPDCFERKIVGGTQGGSGQIAEFYLGFEAE